MRLNQRYRLVEVIGEGGMGRVWAAHDELLGREVAIKEMFTPRGLGSAERDELRHRVIREAQAITRVEHPNVVRVIDVLHERDQPWIVMELIKARSLFEVVRADGPMAPRQAATIGLTVLAALRAAHGAGLLHRDVKPANILLADDGRVVLTDFGLAVMSGDASVTTTGVVLGSPSYMAPERALDLPFGPPSDLWSLGATLYAAVEGRPPYSKSSQAATLAALAGTEPPSPPARAGQLRPVLEALLQKDPAHRADAATAERMLRAVAAGQNPAPMAEAPSAGGRRRPLVIGAAVTAVLALGSVAYGVSARDRTEKEALPPADVPVASISAEASSSPHPASAMPSSKAAAPAEARSHARVTPSRSVPAKASAQAAPPVTTIADNGWYRVVNKKSGMCLDIRGASSADRAPVQQFTCNFSEAQSFLFTETDGGFLRIATQLDTGKHLDVKDQSPADKALIQIWPYNGRQQWKAVSEGNGYFHFVSKFSGKCIDVPEGGTGKAVQLWQFSCNGSAAQSFRLVA
ncbi:serine/threonine protein kinase [Actinoplanes couchii]|nr:serine/threonine protein kinase [Actinoplanes couchii]MDR6319690.1 serine/threonine protein kinase [Actinoplanes couchii]